MRITLEMVESTYDLLRLTPPFKGWKLPPADEIEFHVIPLKDRSADYECLPSGTHCIRINLHWLGSLPALIKILAHEMIHMRQRIAFPQDKSEHGSWFQKAAKLVAKHHHIDPKTL